MSEEFDAAWSAWSAIFIAEAAKDGLDDRIAQVILDDAEGHCRLIADGIPPVKIIMALCARHARLTIDLEGAKAASGRPVGSPGLLRAARQDSHLPTQGDL